MLFSQPKAQNHYAQRNANVPRFQQQPRVPDRLDLLCKHPEHPLPCRMKFIGAAASPKGQWYATYACPLCNSRQGWVFDRRTNRPLRLWVKDSGR